DIERTSNLGTKEVRRRHSDHRERCALDVQRPPDNVGHAAKPTLPESVADPRDRTVGSAAASIVGGCEGAAQDRPNAKRLEETAARPHGVAGPGSCPRGAS